MARGGGQIQYVPHPNALPPNALQIGGAALADFANSLVQLEANQRAKALDALREQALGQQVQAGAMELAKARAEQSGQIDAALSALGIGAPQPHANTVNPILSQLAAQFANPAQLTPLPIAPVTPGAQRAPATGAPTSMLSPQSASELRANPEFSGALNALGSAHAPSDVVNARLARVGQEALRLKDVDKLTSSFPAELQGGVRMLLDLHGRMPAEALSEIGRIILPQTEEAKLSMELRGLQVDALRKESRDAATLEAADRLATTELVRAGLLPQGTEYVNNAADTLARFNAARRSEPSPDNFVKEVRSAARSIFLNRLSAGGSGMTILPDGTIQQGASPSPAQAWDDTRTAIEALYPGAGVLLGGEMPAVPQTTQAPSQSAPGAPSPGPAPVVPGSAAAPFQLTPARATPPVSAGPDVVGDRRMALEYVQGARGTTPAGVIQANLVRALVAKGYPERRAQQIAREAVRDGSR